MINKFEGSLEKRSRGRTLLSRITRRDQGLGAWKRRDFKLEGQTLSYWDGNVRKGELNVAENKLRKVVPEEVNGKEHGFELTLPHGDTPGEKIYLCAESSTARAKWISVLVAAAAVDKWQLRPKTLMKKSGRDVANALVAGPRDDRQLLVLQTLHDCTNKTQFVKNLQALHEELDSLEDSIKQHNDNNLKLSRRRLVDKIEEITRERAAYIIQAFFRRQKSLIRLAQGNKRKHASVRIERLIKAFIFRRNLRRCLIIKSARHVIASLIIRTLSRIRKLRAFRDAPRAIIIENMKGEKVKFDESCASSDFFFYVMSCHDPTGQFRGNQETRVEHGYGLRSTSVYRSEGIKFHITPDWTGQTAIATNSHAQCYIVITLVTRSSKSAPEVFHGQVIVKLADIPEIFDGMGTKATIVRAPLLKYVAPLEDVHGSSILSINDALHRRVDGFLSFTVRIPPNAYTMAGPLYKESGRLLSSEFKRRFFVMVEDKLYYTHGESLLGTVKHLLLCKEINALSTERSQGKECIRIHFFSFSLQKNGSWLVYFPDDVTKAQRSEWLRKIYRCCPTLHPNSPDSIGIREYAEQLRLGQPHCVATSSNVMGKRASFFDFSSKGKSKVKAKGVPV